MKEFFLDGGWWMMQCFVLTNSYNMKWTIIWLSTIFVLYKVTFYIKHEGKFFFPLFWPSRELWPSLKTKGRLTHNFSEVRFNSYMLILNSRKYSLTHRLTRMSTKCVYKQSFLNSFTEVNIFQRKEYRGIFNISRRKKYDSRQKGCKGYKCICIRNTQETLPQKTKRMI